ncbi:TPA: hypothetical protein ACWWDF_002402 [Enterococcus faecium]
MEDYINTVVLWGVGLVMVGAGGWIMGWAILGVGGALGGKEKEWGKAISSFLVGLVGGLIAVWGASNIISFFKTNGQKIPHQ